MKINGKPAPGYLPVEGVLGTVRWWANGPRTPVAKGAASAESHHTNVTLVPLESVISQAWSKLWISMSNLPAFRYRQRIQTFYSYDANIIRAEH